MLRFNGKARRYYSSVFLIYFPERRTTCKKEKSTKIFSIWAIQTHGVEVQRIDCFDAAAAAAAAAWLCVMSKEPFEVK
jgi:hypothetical protein